MNSEDFAKEKGNPVSTNPSSDSNRDPLNYSHPKESNSNAMPKLNTLEHRELTALKLKNAEMQADSHQTKQEMQQNSIERFN
jgi:hypothetical protein